MRTGSARCEETTAAADGDGAAAPENADDADDDEQPALDAATAAPSPPPPVKEERRPPRWCWWCRRCWKVASIALALACLAAQAYLLATLLAGVWHLEPDALAPHERERLLRAQFHASVAARDAAAGWFRLLASLADDGAHCADVARRIALAVFDALRV